MKNSRWIAATARVIALAGLPVVAMAAQPGAQGGLDYGVSAGATYSDNVGRADGGAEESETSVLLGLRAAGQHERQRMTAALNLDLEFQSHSFGDYSDGIAGGAAANVTFNILRDRLAWVVEDNFSQALIESRDTVTPGNSQNLNVFRTGPDIVLPIGRRASINIQGRWRDVTFEDNEFGNHQLSAMLGAGYRIGERSSVSINGSAESVEYKSLPESSDYDIHSAYMAFEVLGNRTQLDLNVGYSRLKEALDSSGGMTYGVELIRQLSSRNRLSVHAGRSFGDSGEALAREQGIRGVSVDDRPVAVSSDPHRSDYVTGTWSVDAARSDLSLSASWRREEHSRSQELNRKALSGGLQLSRQITPRLSISFDSGFNTEEFANSGIEFDEWSVGAGLGWTFSRSLLVDASWDRFAGEGDTILGPGTRDFIENRYSVNLSWSPGR